MARNLIWRVTAGSNRHISNAQDNWSSSFDTIRARWQQYDDEMNYVRESKKLPLRWRPPDGKTKLTPITIAEDSLLKQLSDKCSANEKLANQTYQPSPPDENSLKNLYDEVFEEAGRRYREKIKTCQMAMKKRLNMENIPTSSDGPRVQKHSMINPQRLFTPLPKKSPSFIKRKPTSNEKLTNQKVTGQKVTEQKVTGQKVTEQKVNKHVTPTIDPAVQSKSNISVKETPKIDSDVPEKNDGNMINPQRLLSSIPLVKKSPSLTKRKPINYDQRVRKTDTPTTDPVAEPKTSSKPVKESDVNIKPSQSVQLKNEIIHPAASPLVPTHQMIDPSASLLEMTSPLAPTQHMTSPLIPLHPVPERKSFSQPMHRVAVNQNYQSDMAYNTTSQKPKITFIHPKKSQALYRYIGSNIPKTNITGPISSI